MVDNDGQKVKQKQNLIDVRKWTGESDDTQLLKLATWIRTNMEENKVNIQEDGIMDLIQIYNEKKSSSTNRFS